MAQDSEPLKHDPTFKGPLSQRKCRDVFFLLLFILFWGGMGVVAWQAMTYGDPRLLYTPKDSTGAYCGLDVADKPFLYFLNPFNTTGLQVCVTACPTENVLVATTSTTICKDGVTPTAGTFLSLVNTGECAKFVYASTSIVNRCVPSQVQSLIDAGLSNSTSTAASDAINSQELAAQIVSDFTRTWIWLLAFAGGALVLGFVWVILMRFFANIVVWATIILGLLTINGAAAFLYFAWMETKTENDAYEANNGSLTTVMERQEWTFLGLLIAVGVVAVLMDLVILVLRKRIRIAVQLVKEASKAMQAMPSLLFFPLLTFLFTLVIIAYWVWIEMYLASAKGSPSLQGFDYDLQYLKYAQWYHLFGLLWGVQFISAINQTTIAGAVASWYWTRDKRALPSVPVFKAFGRVLRYHLGSLALGSLVIAVVQLIRTMLFFVQRQAKASKNKVMQWFVACMQCCFACVESLFKFINKNAYIEIAVYGESFCTAARTAFNLLVRNAMRLVAIDSVAAFVMFLGRMFVVASCAAGSYYFLKFYYAAEPLNYISASVVVVMMIAFMVSGVFMFIYSMAIDTIFLCFCEDCERNDGSVQRPYFMSEDLRMLTNVKNLAQGNRKSVNPADNAKVIKSKEAFVRDSF